MSKKVTLYKLSSSDKQTERINDALKQLKLEGLRASFDKLAQDAIKNHSTPYDFLEKLTEHEMNWQNVDRAERRIIQARFPKRKTLADFKFSYQPGINQQQIFEFASCRFIERAENVIFLGPEGVGKTHL